ncbi:MAG: hypothetical protein R3E88_05710 [Myxococcota bacterium]
MSGAQRATSRGLARPCSRMRGVLGAALAALAAFGASAAGAHSQPGTLGASASATDYHQVTCFDDGSGAPASLVVSILDASPGALPLVSVHVRRASSLATASDDATADAVPSPDVAVNESGGAYDVLVAKSGSGAKFYTLEYHCTTAPDGGGVHTGSLLTTLQSQ